MSNKSFKFKTELSVVLIRLKLYIIQILWPLCVHIPLDNVRGSDEAIKQQWNGGGTKWVEVWRWHWTWMSFAKETKGTNLRSWFINVYNFEMLWFCPMTFQCPFLRLFLSFLQMRTTFLGRMRRLFGLK